MPRFLHRDRSRPDGPVYLLDLTQPDGSHEFFSFSDPDWFRWAETGAGDVPPTLADAVEDPIPARVASRDQRLAFIEDGAWSVGEYLGVTEDDARAELGDREILGRLAGHHVDEESTKPRPGTATPSKYLRAVQRSAQAAGYRVTQVEVGGLPAVMVEAHGAWQQHGLPTTPMYVAHLPAEDADLDRLDAFAAEVHTSERARRIPGLYSRGPTSYMVVVATSGAGDDARAWAAKKRGLCFPALVDLSDGTITRWRHAVLGAGDGVYFAGLVDEVLAPALAG